MKFGLASGTVPLQLCAACVPSYTRVREGAETSWCAKCGQHTVVYTIVSIQTTEKK